LAANPAAAKGGPERKHDMSSQIPFTPVTPEALARLTPAERDAFTTAAEQLAGSQKPSMMTIVTLVETVQRLIAVPDEIRRLEIAVAAGDALIREILEALCQRDGQSLESSVPTRREAVANAEE